MNTDKRRFTALYLLIGFLEFRPSLLYTIPTSPFSEIDQRRLSEGESKKGFTTDPRMRRLTAGILKNHGVHRGHREKRQLSVNRKYGFSHRPGNF
jgi:hypothetical protein